MMRAGSKLTIERSTFRFLREPDRKDAPGVRVFSLAITARNQTFKGELLLDGDGRLLRADETTIRDWGQAPGP